MYFPIESNRFIPWLAVVRGPVEVLEALDDLALHVLVLGHEDGEGERLEHGPEPGRVPGVATVALILRPVVAARRVGAGGVIRVTRRAVGAGVEQQHARHSARVLETHQGVVAGGGNSTGLKD